MAVTLGALGAHALKEVLSPEKLLSFKTGVQYQFYHSFVLLIIPSLETWVRHKNLVIASWCFRIGIFLFSGSIFLLSTISITGLEVLRFLGPITPIGGLSFILGWIFLALGLKK